MVCTVRSQMVCVLFLAHACADAAVLVLVFAKFSNKRAKLGHLVSSGPERATRPLCLPSSKVSGGWAGDRTSRASPASSTRAARAKGDRETRGRIGDPHVSAASRSLPRTNLKEAQSSL